MKTCGECIHWLGGGASYVAGCALLVYSGAVPFDQACDWCTDYEDRARQISAAVRQQSQARGDMSGLQQQMMGGLKP